MGELMPRPHDGMRSLRTTDPLAPRLPYKVQRAVDRESAYGLVSAARAQAAGFAAEARVEAVEFVAERAMLGLDRLRRIEASMAKQDPVQAAQYDGLVDDFLMVARSELRRLPQGVLMGYVISLPILLLVLALLGIAGLSVRAGFRFQQAERVRDRARIRVIEGQLAMLRAALRIGMAEQSARRHMFAMGGDVFDNRTDHEEWRPS